MRRFIFFLVLNLFLSCAKPYKGKITEVYNDGEALKVQIFVPSNWDKYGFYGHFRDEVEEYSSAIGSKDTASYIIIKILNLKDFPVSYIDIDSVLTSKMLTETKGDTTVTIISKEKLTNSNGKNIGTCFYTSGIEIKYYYKMMIFVKNKKAGVLTLVDKKENELLKLADQIESTLNF
jgi:hypothetical protein